MPLTVWQTVDQVDYLKIVTGATEVRPTLAVDAHLLLLTSMDLSQCTSIFRLTVIASDASTKPPPPPSSVEPSPI
jgi:hypothetical protein